MVDALPLFPLGTVLFPDAFMPLQIFEPRYRALMQDLMAEPEPWEFGVVAIREGHEVGADSVRSLYDIGCTARVRQAEQLPDGRIAVLVVGGERFRIREVDRSRLYLQASVEMLDEPPVGEVAIDALVATVRERCVAYLDALGSTASPRELPADPTSLSYAVAGFLAIGLADRQSLLETPDPARRLRAEGDLLTRELFVMRTLRAMPVTPQQLPRHSQN